MKRRTFLKSAGLVAGGLAATASMPGVAQAQAEIEAQGKRAPTLWNNPSDDRPNILVIIVDQLRFPQGLITQEVMDLVAPDLKELREKSVTFDSHYAAATMCSPSRSTMLTGLYTHQNGMFLTNTQGLFGSPVPTPDLDVGFPTWGSILNGPDFRYNTYWWGKWHLSGNDATTPRFAQQYGFVDGGLPCPAPNGGPGQGLGVDPLTASVFTNWLDSYMETDAGPWCTTVSLTDPHDIAWYPRYTQGSEVPPTNPMPGQEFPPPVFYELPDNFERWPEALELQGKPGWQQAFVLLVDLLIGVMPTNPGGPGYPELWHQLLDLYLQLMRYVDWQIGTVLDAINNETLYPGLAENTIIIFTSDHGEYGGAHGMRNKGYAVYEESIRVPFYVYDPTGQFVPADMLGSRNQMTSHVDLVPLLMSLAGAGDDWRTMPQYAHLAGRADLAAMLSDATAPGREYIITSTDEDIPSEAPQTGTPIDEILDIINGLGRPPGHVIGYRTNTAKLGVYSYFAPGTIDIEQDGQESELYNYAADGIGEVINHSPSGSAPDLALYDQLYDAVFNPVTGAVPTELRQPVPDYLRHAQRRAMNRYIAYQNAVQPPSSSSIEAPSESQQIEQLLPQMNK